jgi:Spy/CpxP family protein refolding chaperone
MNEKTWRRLRLVTVGFALGLAAAPEMVRAQDAAKPSGNDNDAQQAAQDTPRQGQGQGRRRGGPGGPGGAGRMSPVQTVDRSKEDVMALDLKDDQKTKLNAIFKDASEQAKSLETEVASMQGRERMEKIQPFNRDLREKVAGVLTEEQKQALRKKMAGRAAEQMTDRWKQALGQLNLTSEQQTKVDAILADARKNAEQQAAQSPPDAGQGQGQGRGGALFASMRETRQKIEEVLTAEQKQKLQELMPPGGRGGQGGRGRGGNNAPQQ